MILGVKNIKESFKKKMIKLRIAIQMDPLNKLHLESDSSLILAKEAQNRNHKIFIYEPKDLTLSGNQLFANASSLKIEKKNKYFFKKGKSRIINLSSIDILLVRQDPPFNMHYITSTYLLDCIRKSTIVINNPTAVRNCTEKILPFKFKEFMPPTLISQKINDILNFLKVHKDIITKPLYGNGGEGINRSIDGNLIGVETNGKELITAQLARSQRAKVSYMMVQTLSLIHI